MMPLPKDAIGEIAALLMGAPDSAARAALIASSLVEVLPDSACVIHRFLLTNGDAVWNAIGIAGDISIEQASLPVDSRLIAPLLSAVPPVLIYSSAEIRREDFSHLHVARSVGSLAYVPLLNQNRLTGVIEILTFSGSLTAARSRRDCPDCPTGVARDPGSRRIRAATR